MKTFALIGFLTMAGVSLLPGITPDAPALPVKLTVTPELKKAFAGSDAIEIREITGTSAKFQVGETYRVSGICHQESLKNATLYLGNTAEPGAAAIVPRAGSSLFQALPNGSTEFAFTFTLLRPGIVHVTMYDQDNRTAGNNVAGGLYLGDVVFRH